MNLKTLVRTEAKKECEVTLEVVELAEMEVDEEEVEWITEGEAQFQEEGGDLDPRLLCVSLCMAASSLSQSEPIEDVRKTSRCVAFLAVENVTCATEIWKKVEVEKGRAGVRGV